MMFERFFEQQAAPIQDFLLRTCITAHLTPDLASRLAEVSLTRATDLLRRVEQDTPYLLLLDSDRQRYRYQPLFREFLCQRLPPELARELHLRAGRWYAQANDTFPAIDHTLLAQEYALATDLIHLAYKELLSSGRLAQLEDWIEQVPDGLVSKHAVLLLIKVALQIYRGDIESAVHVMEQIRLVTSPDQQEALHDEILAVERLLNTVQGAPPTPMGEIDRSDFFSCIMALGLALQYANAGDMEMAYPLYRQVAASPMPFVASSAVGNWADVLYRKVRLHEAYTLYQHALEISASQQPPSASTGWFHLQLATILHEWNEIDRAMLHLPSALTLCEAWGHTNMIVHSYQLQAWLEHARGRRDQALAVLQRLQGVASDETSVRWAQAQQAHLHLLQGEYGEAAAWLARTEVGEHYTLSHVTEYLTQIRFWIATGEHRDAANRLRWLSRHVAGDVRLEFRHLTLRALLAHVRGRQSTALDVLDRALPLASAERLVRSLLNEGPSMIELLASYANGRLAEPHPYGDFFLACGVTPPYLHLTDREMQVLALVAEGLTNAEVASRLTISTGTVKKHLDNVYRKLGARNRTEAVTIALARDLL